jgi:hypothetical protein
MFGKGDERIGDKNPMWGKHVSEENKRKASIRFSGGNGPRAKIIVDKDGNEWDCLLSCSKHFKVSNGHLSCMLNGKEKMYNKLENLGLHYKP